MMKEESQTAERSLLFWNFDYTFEMIFLSNMINTKTQSIRAIRLIILKKNENFFYQSKHLTQ